MSINSFPRKDNSNMTRNDEHSAGHSGSDEFQCFLMIRSLMEEKHHPWPTLSDMVWLHERMTRKSFTSIFRMLDDMSEMEEKTRCMTRLGNMFSMSGLEMPDTLNQWLVTPPC